jgi:hypothetical protein
MDVEFLLSRLSTFLGLKLDSWGYGPERDRWQKDPVAQSLK